MSDERPLNPEEPSYEWAEYEGRLMIMSECCGDSFSESEELVLLAHLSAKHADPLRARDERVWDECLDAIEKHEINTEQAREGNPYRVVTRAEAVVSFKSGMDAALQRAQHVPEGYVAGYPERVGGTLRNDSEGSK